MNILKKALLIGGILLAIDAIAFGHIDMRKLRQHAMALSGSSITACSSDPECEPELADLSQEVIRAARYVTVCWDLPHCKKSSISNFTAVCEPNSECQKIVEDLVEHEVTVFEECMIDHECKTSLTSCWANHSCQAHFEACTANPANDNPACEKVYDIYPEGFLEKFIE